MGETNGKRCVVSLGAGRGVLVLAAAIGAAGLPRGADAAALDWDNAAGGDADVASNWLPSVVPGAADDLDFDLAATYQVNWDGSISDVNSIDVLRGDTTFFSNSGATNVTTAGNLVVADGTGGTAALTLDNRAVWNVGNAARVGFNPGDSGRLTVDGPLLTLNVAASLELGTRGAGELFFEDGDLIVQGDFNAASSTTGSAGTALINLNGNSSGDEFRINGATTLGSSVFPAGVATLNMTGGLVRANGAVTVNDGSTVTIAGGSFNANAGFDNSHGGTLNLNDGTLAVSHGAFLPNAAGNTLTIDGPTAVETPHLFLGTNSTTDIAGPVNVGAFNQGELTLRVTVGDSVLNSTTGNIGSGVTGVGIANVEDGSEWNLTSALTVGSFGSGTLNIIDGGAVDVAGPTSRIADHTGASGVVNVSDGGTLNTRRIYVAESGHGTLNITDGGVVTSDLSSTIGDNAAGTGIANVDGVGSAWTLTGFSSLSVGDRGNGTLNITNGGTVNAAVNVTIADNSGSMGVANVTGPGSLLSVGSDLNVGAAGSDGGTATLNVTDSGRVEIDDELSVYHDGTLIIDGGDVVAEYLDNTSGGTVDFLAGSLTLNDGLTIGNDPGGLFAGSVTLDADRALGTAATTTIATGRTLTLDGGTLTTGDFAGDGELVFNAGTLNVTGTGGFTFSNTGPLGSVFSLSQDTELNVTNTATVFGGSIVVIEDGAVLNAGTTTGQGEIVLGGSLARINGTTVANAGLLRGDGRVNATLTNQAGGEVRIEAGDRIIFNAPLGTNHGMINLQGGTAEFTSNFGNEAGGLIVGRGNLIVERDITNAGDFALSNGQTDVFGDLYNLATGRVMVSGHADVTFWDDVFDNGTLFNVSAGSSVTFFGSAGFGVSGGGDVFFEADITPGNSPGLEAFGGNVFFGTLADLEIELEGTARGSGYDALDVAGTASLSGTLDVSLLGGFTPSAGESYEILNAAGGVTGTFSSEALPALSGGLTWDVVYDANSVTLAVLGGALVGDYNSDGFVSQGDLDLVLLNWGDSVAPAGFDENALPGGGPFDGLIGQNELDGVLLNWGNGTPPAAGVIPEPGTAALFVLPIAALLRRRGR